MLHDLQKGPDSNFYNHCFVNTIAKLEHLFFC